LPQPLNGAAGLSPVNDVALLRQIRQVEHTDARGNAIERRADFVNMLATGSVVVTEDDAVGACKESSVLRGPFPGTARVAGRWHTPRPQQIGFALALGDDYRTAAGDRLKHLR
jgi:hypothetical protein